MSKGHTKGRILRAALRLFNERGTAAVSTNHIAEEARISPGNLYYHYRNKEEIIRDIFDEVDAHWKEAYSLPADGAPAPEDVRAIAERTFSGLWEYRFFYRELGALTNRDPELGRRYRQLRQRGLSGTEEILRAFAEAGVLEGLEEPASISRLAKTLMLVAEFWLPFEEAGGEVSEPALAQEGAELMMEILNLRLRGVEGGGRAGHAGAGRGRGGES